MADELASMNVSLPKGMRDWMRQRMKDRGFANASEYVRQLIRQDADEAHEEEVDRLLEEGLNSGEPIPVTPEFWKQLDERVKVRVAELRKAPKRRKAG